MPRKPLSTPPAKPSQAEQQLAFALNIRTPRERSEHARERRYQAERDLLVAVLSRLWPSHITSAARRKLVWTDIVCIHSPAGQLAWGLPVDRAHWFSHLERAECQWDGHGPGERDARLRALLKLDTLVPMEPITRPRPARRRRKGAK